jgi:hypothetical protein
METSRVGFTAINGTIVVIITALFVIVAYSIVAIVVSTQTVVITIFWFKYTVTSLDITIVNGAIIIVIAWFFEENTFSFRTGIRCAWVVIVTNNVGIDTGIGFSITVINCT